MGAAACLPALPRLRSLDFSHNWIGESGAIALAMAIGGGAAFEQALKLQRLEQKALMQKEKGTEGV
jgi:hypothetical protein